MASLLAACLAYLSDRPLEPQDRTTLQTLRSEFKLELAALQGNLMATAPWPNEPSARLLPVSMAQPQGTGQGTIADDANLDLNAVHWLRQPHASATETARSMPQRSSWQVAEGNVRLRGIVAVPDTTHQGEPSLCNLGTCGSFGRLDPSHTLTTLEYTQTLGERSQNRLALGLHYVSNDIDRLPQNQVGINAEATFGKFEFFGQASLDLNPKPNQTASLLGDRTIPLWTAGVGIRDFIIPQSVLTVSAGRAASLDNESQPTQINYGAFYQFPIGDRLTLSPSVVIMANPTDPDSVPQIQGALQASFSF